MTQSPRTLRSISLPGWFAACVVVLASGLLSALPCRAAEDGPSTPGADGTRPPAAGACAADPAAPAFCRRGAPPSGEVVRRSHPAGPGGDSRHAGPVVILVHFAGMGAVELALWQPPFRGCRTPAPRPPLHVLFCTWLT